MVKLSETETQIIKQEVGKTQDGDSICEYLKTLDTEIDNIDRRVREMMVGVQEHSKSVKADSDKMRSTSRRKVSRGKKGWTTEARRIKEEALANKEYMTQSIDKQMMKTSKLKWEKQLEKSDPYFLNKFRPSSASKKVTSKFSSVKHIAHSSINSRHSSQLKERSSHQNKFSASGDKFFEKLTASRRSIESKSKGNSLFQSTLHIHPECSRNRCEYPKRKKLKLTEFQSSSKHSGEISQERLDNAKILYLKEMDRLQRLEQRRQEEAEEKKRRETNGCTFKPHLTSDDHMNLELKVA